MEKMTLRQACTKVEEQVGARRQEIGKEITWLTNNIRSWRYQISSCLDILEIVVAIRGKEKTGPAASAAATLNPSERSQMERQRLSIFDLERRREKRRKKREKKKAVRCR